MNFREALKNKVKPELNNIYIDPPFSTSTGLDYGWYCREHALHLYALAKLFGYEVSICLGDFYANSPGESYIESMTTDSDHAWCSINKVSPVDISITLKHIFKLIPDIAIVYGQPQNGEGDFKIIYHVGEENEALIKSFDQNQRFITYNQKEVRQYDPIKLLESPYDFLLPVPSGFPTFQEAYGNDIFYRITYHCYKLIVDQHRKPLCKYRGPKESMKAMINFNEDAKKEMTRMLG